MRTAALLVPIATFALAAVPAAAQEAPRVLFCAGQCFGIDAKGARIPITKGTVIAPGLKLETGPSSYLQVKLGPDNACGIGENARVRFDRATAERDVVTLDQGRIRVIGGELIGRPVARPVELRTAEGPILLRNADIEVKTLPKSPDVPLTPTLVKLNVGDARIGDLPVSKDGVQGISGGKVLERAIPLGEIVLPTPVREPAAKGDSLRPVRPPLLTQPVIGLPIVEARPLPAPTVLSPAIVTPTTLAAPTTSTNLSPTNALSVNVSAISPTILPSSTLVLAQPVTTSTGTTTSLNDIAKTIQSPTLTSSSTPTSQTSTSTSPLLSKDVTIQLPVKTTSGSTGLTPKTLTQTR